MGYQSKKIRPVRLEVSLPETILAGVDDYRFATRAPNRAEAIRRLLKVGQAATPAPRRRPSKAVVILCLLAGAAHQMQILDAAKSPALALLIQGGFV
jgi:hypothetical protein